MNRKQRRAVAKLGKTSSNPLGETTAAVQGAGELLGAGLKHHQAGRFAEAEACYRRVLAIQSDHADALHLLGVIAHQVRRYDLAVELIGRAIKRNGENPFYYSSLGSALRGQGKVGEAIAAFRQAIVIMPAYAEAHYNLGNALNHQGKLNETVAAYRQAIGIKPDYAEAHSNLGNALQDLGKLDEAVAAYRHAIGINPDNAEVHCNLGVALKDQGKIDEAVAAYHHALGIKPDYAEAHSNLGNALKQQGKLDEAVAAYSQAIRIEPALAEAHSNLGNALRGQGKLDDALASYDRALSVRPNHAEALNNRGNVLTELKRYGEALASYDRALAAKPDHAHAFSGAADCVMNLCDWDRRTRFAAEVDAHVAGKKSIISPFVLLGCSSDPALQLQCARNYIENEVALSRQPFWTGQMWRHDKVRVAYLSADFRNHPGAYLMAGLFEEHNRSRFEIVGVSFGVDDRSEMRKRLISAFDEFHDVRGTGDKDVAKLLYDRRIDIAIDRNGYTRDARSGIFLYRPAPIQVSYLGYPGTMGTQFIDYISSVPTLIEEIQLVG